MTYEEYEKIDAINWSRLKAMRISPLQYWFETHNPREDEPAFLRIGSAVHAHILEPDLFTSRFARFTGKARRGKEWAAFKEEHAGKTILNAEEWDAAFGAAAAVLANRHAAKYLMAGLKEATFTWTDEDTGLKCKGRIDHAGTYLVDLKTAARMNQRIFASAAARLGYHSQLAFYSDGLAANDLPLKSDPIMIAVQSEMPHDVIVYRMPPHVIEAGRSEYRRLLAKLRECLDKNEWPGAAPDGPVDFQLPSWAYMDDTDVALTMGGVALGGL